MPVKYRAFFLCHTWGLGRNPAELQGVQVQGEHGLPQQVAKCGDFRDFHYSEYEDTRTESHENRRIGPCEALIGELRTELSQNDATITLHGRGNIHNRVPMSYKVFL